MLNDMQRHAADKHPEQHAAVSMGARRGSRLMLFKKAVYANPAVLRARRRRAARPAAVIWRSVLGARAEALAD